MDWKSELLGVYRDFRQAGEANRLEHYSSWSKRELPINAWKSLAKKGLFSASTEKGLAGSAEWFAAAIEGYSRGSQDLAFNIAPVCHGLMCSSLLNIWGKTQAKQKYLASITSGEKISAFAVTESESGGTDAYRFNCRLTSTTSGQVLNGNKWHITNMPDASLIFAWCMDDTLKNVTCVIVEKDWPGVTVSPQLSPFGAGTSPVASVEFHNVVIPQENIIQFSNGIMALTNILVAERVICGFPCIGVIESMIDKVVPFLSSRKVNGIPLADRQYMQLRVTRMETSLMELRGFAHYVLNKYKNHNRVLAEASALKIAGPRAVRYCAEQAIKATGTYGLQEASQFAMQTADATASFIGGGTTEAHRQIIWENTLRKRSHSKENLWIHDDLNLYPFDPATKEHARIIDRRALAKEGANVSRILALTS